VVVFAGKPDQERTEESIFAIGSVRCKMDVRVLTLLLPRSPVERRADNVLRNPPTTRSSQEGPIISTRIKT
jgi:hypothetical protein